MKLLLTLVTSLVLSVNALATPIPVPPPDTQAPGYYRMILGKLHITAVSDGTVTIPLDNSPTFLPINCANNWQRIH